MKVKVGNARGTEDENHMHAMGSKGGKRRGRDGHGNHEVAESSNVEGDVLQQESKNWERMEKTGHKEREGGGSARAAKLKKKRSSCVKAGKGKTGHNEWGQSWAIE